MNPWEVIARTPVPNSRDEMELVRRGEEWIIRVDGQPLMSSRVHGSEDALAEMAFERMPDTANPRVLIGGLGMGFTAAAALRLAPPAARIEVAELVPAVVEWNRGPLGEVAGRPLNDERLVVHEGDVIEKIRGASGSWDAILLDVDNGPDGLTRESNGWLYEEKGLRALLTAMSPHGVLAVWSANDDRSFTQRLTRCGYQVEVIPVRGRAGNKGSRHTVWLAIPRGKKTSRTHLNSKPNRLR